MMSIWKQRASSATVKKMVDQDFVFAAEKNFKKIKESENKDHFNKPCHCLEKTILV